MISRSTYFLSALLIFFAGVSTPSSADWLTELQSLPVQDAGRVKPFDTFAREAMQLVYGKRKFNQSEAAEVVLTWIVTPDLWASAPIIEIRHSGLKEAMSVEKEKRYFSMSELLGNVKLPLVFGELQNRRERQEKLNPYFQAVQRLENQLGILQVLAQEGAPGMVPPKEGDKWLAPRDFSDPMKEKFSSLVQAFVAYATNKNSADAEKSLESSIIDFRQAATEEGRALSKSQVTRVNLEVHYNIFHPFLWSWISYLIGVILMGAFMIRGYHWQSVGGWIFLALGFALHTYGMGMRMYLAERPPVSNMYETVVWVPWGAILFGYVLERLQKNKLVLVSSAAIAVVCLILTDLAPAVLDPSIHPLEPVLRSTFWLTTHVLIITISYAAFFLAFALGDLLLFYYLVDEDKYAVQIRNGVQSIYRCLQIGVVLLAAGIILGGVWADYSWGRFWGWDPKETWALIALLGYIAILHARIVGWIKPFGMALSSVLSFSLVIMAWYGVNFVLGAGLHSYGFGAGGVEYVTGFVVLHILYATYVTTVRYGRRKRS